MIVESRLMMVGLPGSSFFEKHKVRKQDQLQHLTRKMSTTYMLNSDILLSPSPASPLKPLVFKSLVLSNHLKIALWIRLSNEP